MPIPISSVNDPSRRVARGVSIIGGLRDVGTGTGDRGDGDGGGARPRVRVRRGRARRARRGRDDGPRCSRHAAECAAEGVHGRPQRCRLDEGARGAGRHEGVGRARELRPVLYLLPRRRGRVRGRDPRRCGRRQRPSGCRGRRAGPASTRAGRPGGAMRLGLMSTANINGALLAATPDEVEIAAVASRDGAKAQAYASEHGIARSHASYEALLEDDAIDAVYISLPNGMHHEWTMKAIDAGKHVLVEKPYSRRPAEVEQAWDAAERAGVLVMEAFMYRHHPQADKARELVAEGAIGTLRAIRATFSFQLEDLTNIRMLPDLDGGALMDVGCYCISGSRLLGGEPERVVGEQRLGPTGVDVDFFGTLRFPGEVVAQFDASFSLPKRQRLEAVGEEGV